MENNKLFKAVEGSTQDILTTLNRGSSARWDIQSQKTKYVNGKMSGVIGVGYSASIDNTSDYILEEDKGNNQIQITAQYGGTSGLCVLTQNESGNKINLHLTTPEDKEYWEIRFTPNPYSGANMDTFFKVSTNLRGEEGSMADGTQYKNWIVNRNRNTINIYISPVYPANDFNILSWSCLDKDGNAFITRYDLLDNSYFTIETIGLGSYALKKISSPPSSSQGTIVFSSRLTPTKKYPLNLNFYWEGT